MSSTEQQPEESFSYGDDIKVSRNAHDAKPVPLDGKNTPSGMTDENWQARPEIVEAPVDSSVYGEQFVKLEGQRKVLQNTKKDLQVLHKLVVKVNQSHTQKDVDERDKMLRLMDADMEQFSDVAWYQQYKDVTATARKDDLTEEQLIKFAHDEIKRVGQQIFNYDRKLLQEQKAEKQKAIKQSGDKTDAAPGDGEGNLLGPNPGATSVDI